MGHRRPPFVDLLQGRQHRDHSRREGPRRSSYRFDNRAAERYERCADAQRKGALHEAYAKEEKWLDETLREMLSLEVMVELDGRYLALALPANPHH